MNSQPPRTRYSLSIALLVCLASPSVMAATLPGDQDLIRDRQNRLLEEQQRRLQELQDLPGKADKPQAPATPAAEGEAGRGRGVAVGADAPRKAATGADMSAIDYPADTVSVPSGAADEPTAVIPVQEN